MDQRALVQGSEQTWKHPDHRRNIFSASRLKQHNMITLLPSKSVYGNTGKTCLIYIISKDK